MLDAVYNLHNNTTGHSVFQSQLSKRPVIKIKLIRDKIRKLVFIKCIVCAYSQESIILLNLSNYFKFKEL